MVLSKSSTNEAVTVYGGAMWMKTKEVVSVQSVQLFININK